MTVSIAQLNPLGAPDGSATYSRGGYTVLAAVNGPIEVSRKNELPEETSLEVNIRPASGVGGPLERHLEEVLARVLRRVVLVRHHPRTLVQVTCQVLGLPEGYESGIGGASSYLPILPALLQSSILALLSACIPLSQTLSSTCIAVLPQRPEDNTSDRTKKRVTDPTPLDAANATSLHVLAFSSLKDHALLLCESEGMFDMDEYEDVYSDALARCCRSDTSHTTLTNTTAAGETNTTMELDGDDASGDESGGVALGGDADAPSGNSEQAFVEKTVARHIREARRWKEDVAG